MPAEGRRQAPSSSYFRVVRIRRSISSATLPRWRRQPPPAFGRPCESSAIILSSPRRPTPPSRSPELKAGAWTPPSDLAPAFDAIPGNSVRHPRERRTRVSAGTARELPWRRSAAGQSLHHPECEIRFRGRREPGATHPARQPGARAGNAKSSDDDARRGGLDASMGMPGGPGAPAADAKTAAAFAFRIEADSLPKPDDHSRFDVSRDLRRGDDGRRHLARQSNRVPNIGVNAQSGITMALLLPAVQAARKAARDAVAKNAAAAGTSPPGATPPAATTPPAAAKPDTSRRGSGKTSRRARLNG